MDKTQITFELILRSVNSFDVKNDDSIIEKTMKGYFKAVMLSLKIYENIL